MAEPLMLDRFRALADAYGGAVAAWPEAVRAEATRMAADPDARAILTAAGALDETLDLWRVPAPERALFDRIVQAAPAARTGALRRARLWWSGLGVAVSLAGAAAGSLATATVASPYPPAESATAFGDLSDQES